MSTLEPTKRFAWFLVAAGVVICGMPKSVAAKVITFDTFGDEAGDQTIDLTTTRYFERGFDMTGWADGSANVLVIDDPTSDNYLWFEVTGGPGTAKARVQHRFTPLRTLTLVSMEVAVSSPNGFGPGDALLVEASSGGIRTITTPFDGILRFTGPDWERLDWVEVKLTTETGFFPVSVSVDNIYTIPEPSSAVTLFWGILLVACCVRRRAVTR